MLEIEMGIEHLNSVLLPLGQNSRADFNAEDRKELLQQYKVMMNSMSQLAIRQQTTNSFFLSINSLLIAGMGILLKEAIGDPITHFNVGVMIIGMSVAGYVLCRHWTLLLESYSRMSSAKRQIIMLMEKHMVAAVYTAEYNAVGQERISLGKLERRISLVFRILYCITTIISIVSVAHMLTQQ